MRELQGDPAATEHALVLAVAVAVSAAEVALGPEALARPVVPVAGVAPRAAGVALTRLRPDGRHEQRFSRSDNIYSSHHPGRKHKHVFRLRTETLHDL